MAKGDSLDPTHSVLRRFDAKDANFATSDEEVNIRRPTRNAFVFDDHRFGEDRRGCSVYELEELERLDIRPSATLNKTQSALAVVSVEAIARLRIDDSPNLSPFAALEDRYPDGEVDVPAIDAAHAMIVRPNPVANKADWLVALAEAARRFPLDDEGAAGNSMVDSGEPEKSNGGERTAPAPDGGAGEIELRD